MTNPPGVNTANWVDVFDRERPRLLGLAYRTIGTYSDAEDVVQEAWVRASEPIGPRSAIRPRG